MSRYKGRMLSVMLTVLLFPLVTAIHTAGGAEFDYRHYEALLKAHVTEGVVIDGIAVNAVDYAALAEAAKRPDSDYTLLLEELAAFDPGTLETTGEKKAFWINAYNIAAIKTLVDHHPVDSIRSRSIHWLGRPWNRKVLPVGGKEYALGEIEHDLLLDTFKDLRVHFAINCASVSCVDLVPEPYRGQDLSRRLDERGRVFLADSRRGFRLDREKKTVFLSQVFNFDRKRFDQWAGGALSFILPYLSDEDRTFLEQEKVSLEYLDYNWKANGIRH